MRSGLSVSLTSTGITVTTGHDASATLAFVFITQASQGLQKAFHFSGLTSDFSSTEKTSCPIHSKVTSPPNTDTCHFLILFSFYSISPVRLPYLLT